MLSRRRIPLVILGGRDRRGSELPDGVEDRHPLHGYKGALLRFDGKPLVQVLIERMRAVEVFHPIYIAGPRHVYEEFLDDDVCLIETDGSFGANLRATLEGTRVDGDYPWQLAYVTCDILPDPDELERAVADLEHHVPVDFWMPQIRVPEGERSLGQSDWKPRYSLSHAGSGEPVPVLPGHLLVAAPGILRLEFTLRFLDALYETRNRPLAYRRAALTRTLLGSLLMEDLRHLVRLKLPRNLFDVVFWSLYAVAKLATGNASTREMERYLRRAFVFWDHRRKHPERRGRVPILDALSLAKDIDTLEEAREVAGDSVTLDAAS